MKSEIEKLLEPFGFPTLYNKTIFASELEAMWAALFNRLKIKFEYEPFGRRTFPDFYFPDLHVYGEVKPDRGKMGHPWKDATVMPAWIREHKRYAWQWLPFASRQPLVIFAGLIGNNPVCAVHGDGTLAPAAEFAGMNDQTFQLSKAVSDAKNVIWNLRN